MFVVSKDFPAMLKLSLREPAAAGADPSTLRYRSGFGFMITSSGLSAIAPPWTTMTAYDLNVGTHQVEDPAGRGAGARGERADATPAATSRRSGPS